MQTLEEQTLEVLLRIHCEVLDTDRVGAGDNFFDLGGTSMTGVRITRRIQQEFGVRVPAKAVFAAASLADLATVTAAARAEGAGP
ncbi:phosphopantetheine-binding protein (plasmid) [Streptomyces sp. NBC_00440]|uniref:phosphopantetheine-binding protein n=1 Tax=unclassified Streptomyces TaxID=2593676 RepID=UPI002E1D2FEA|nr:phosphopantetheine-binding protein [Streptomyces sp. NBC_00963]